MGFTWDYNAFYSDFRGISMKNEAFLPLFARHSVALLRGAGPAARPGAGRRFPRQRPGDVIYPNVMDDDV